MFWISFERSGETSSKDSGGILVREARDLKSPACAMRLAKDSEIQQLELIGHSAAKKSSWSSLNVANPMSEDTNAVGIVSY